MRGRARWSKGGREVRERGGDETRWKGIVWNVSVCGRVGGKGERKAGMEEGSEEEGVMKEE